MGEIGSRTARIYTSESLEFGVLASLDAAAEPTWVRHPMTWIFAIRGFGITLA